MYITIHDNTRNISKINIQYKQRNKLHKNNLSILFIILYPSTINNKHASKEYGQRSNARNTYRHDNKNNITIYIITPKNRPMGPNNSKYNKHTIHNHPSLLLYIHKK